MAVSVKRNFGHLADLPLSNRQLMHEIGLLARERIIRRTLAGRSTEGNAFTPYSTTYAAQKGKALGGAGTVNLQVSGRMLQGIVEIGLTESSVVLGFKD